MSTYVCLLNWTDQGVRDAKATVDRSKAARDLASRMGGELRDLYWTMGPYDLVATATFPDSETATAFLVALSSQGNIRTTGMPAFSEDEMTGILGKVG
ncbi:MAG TPA: GYD domain-containing protein [Micromonosporaceae bacterium]